MKIKYFNLLKTDKDFNYIVFYFLPSISFCKQYPIKKDKNIYIGFYISFLFISLYFYITKTPKLKASK